MTRDEILKAAGAAVADRPDRYGRPEDAFARVAKVWEWYLTEAAETTVPIGAHDVAAMMALLKISRLIETPTHADSWVDLAGYAACGGEVAPRPKQPVAGAAAHTTDCPWHLDQYESECSCGAVHHE